MYVKIFSFISEFLDKKCLYSSIMCYHYRIKQPSDEKQNLETKTYGINNLSILNVLLQSKQD